MDYEKEKELRLANANKRAADAVAASNFLATPEGALIQEWINQRIGYLIEKLSAKDPATDREYLSMHGGIRELKDFNSMLNSKSNAGVQARQEIDELTKE